MSSLFILMVENRVTHRRSQDFLWDGCMMHFSSPNKLTCFMSSPSNHRLQLLNYPLPPNTRTGLFIVPVVLWEGAPAARERGPRSTAKQAVFLRSLTTEKGRQLFGRRKVYPQRENPGYAYEKRAPALWWYGATRMDNPALPNTFPQFPKKKLDSYYAWGCTLCLGCTYNFFSVNLAPNFFFTLGGARACSTPPGYAYAVSK